MAAEGSDSVHLTVLQRRDIVVIGASAGGVEALRQLVSGLPPGLPAAVFVVVHIPPHMGSVLPELLARSGPLPAAHAQDGEEVRPGRIYVAPPDRHLLLSPGTVRLSAGPRENHSRPAADPLFRSAALSYGPRVAGVVLSGALSDGCAGLWEIKRRGGLAIVQDPGDALYPSMPHSAIDQVPVDHVLPAADIPRLIARLARPTAHDMVQSSTATDWQPMERANGAPEGTGRMGEINRAQMLDEKPGEAEVKRDQAEQMSGQRDGAVTVYVCPECGGTLWQANAGNILQFRCHVGHVYGGSDLLEGYTTEMERSLWWAIRTLRDKANLFRQIAENARERGAVREAERYDAKARKDDEHAETIIGMVEMASTNRSP